MVTEKRLIDANALLEKLSRMIDYCKNDNKVSGLTALFQVGDAIIDCPTVDAVEVVHGRWIDNIDENGYLCNAWRKCSACGGLNWSKRPNYCPNCGAKMDGGKDNE